jgi:hypothetical protein
MVRMPTTWSLDTPPQGHALSGAAVSALLEVAAGPASAQRLLSAIKQVVPVEYLSLVEFRRQRQDVLPELVQGCSDHTHDRDVVAECFAIYRRSYYQSDAVMHLAEQVGRRPAREVAALHCRADELPVAGWRNDIYVRERLTERFSLLHAPAPGVVHAIHLYRDERQGLFHAGEIGQLLALAPLLRQAHHASLRAASAAADLPARVANATDRLHHGAPRLSPRERAVCARIACGISADGIAAELDIAPSTVITLRKRAYVKLAELGLPAHRMGLARWVN